MKLNADQLPRSLSQGLRPVYLLSGDEPLQLQEAGDLLRRTARANGFDEREVFHADPGFQWERLRESGQSLSLFSQRRLLELHLPNGKPGPQGSDALLALLSPPDGDTLLVIFAPRLDGATLKSRWVKTIEEQGCLVQAWPVDAAQLPRWLQQRLAQAGLRASRDALALLAERVEGNLLAAAQEVEKLALLYPGQELDTEAVLNAVGNSSRYDIFGFGDALLQGQAERSIRMLQGLRAEGVEPAIVLWAVTRELRALADLHSAQQAGRPLDPVLKKHRAWGARKSALQSALRHTRPAQLLRLLQACARTDQAIKGAAPLDPWQQLQRITLTLSGKVDTNQIRNR